MLTKNLLKNEEFKKLKNRKKTGDFMKTATEQFTMISLVGIVAIIAIVVMVIPFKNNQETLPNPRILNNQGDKNLIGMASAPKAASLGTKVPCNGVVPGGTVTVQYTGPYPSMKLGENGNLKSGYGPTPTVAYQNAFDNAIAHTESLIDNYQKHLYAHANDKCAKEMHYYTAQDGSQTSVRCQADPPRKVGRVRYTGVDKDDKPIQDPSLRRWVHTTQYMTPDAADGQVKSEGVGVYQTSSSVTSFKYDEPFVSYNAQPVDCVAYV